MAHGFDAKEVVWHGLMPVTGSRKLTVRVIAAGSTMTNWIDYIRRIRYTRACLKNHSCHLHALLCVIFAPNSGYIAHYAPFIWHKSLTNCDAHLTESIFQTCSRACLKNIWHKSPTKRAGREMDFQTIKEEIGWYTR